VLPARFAALFSGISLADATRVRAIRSTQWSPRTIIRFVRTQRVRELTTASRASFQVAPSMCRYTHVAEWRLQRR
jgi:hypothetical protein